MKLNLTYINEDGETLDDLKKVCHALVYQISKGVFYIDVSFNCRVEIDHFGSDNDHSEDIYFSVPDEIFYIVLKVNAEEGQRIDVFGDVSKKNYRGIVCFSNLISKAINKRNGESR